MSEEIEKLRVRHMKEMNLVLGVVTPLLIGLSFDWIAEVSPLCNFAGDFDETTRKWQEMGHQASDRLCDFRQQLAAAREENERWRKAMEAIHERSIEWVSDDWAGGWLACVEAMEAALK